jgi:hypothetical protein
MVYSLWVVFLQSFSHYVQSNAYNDYHVVAFAGNILPCVRVTDY